jgi:hypothetical protein
VIGDQGVLGWEGANEHCEMVVVRNNVLLGIVQFAALMATTFLANNEVLSERNGGKIKINLGRELIGDGDELINQQPQKQVLDEYT